MTSGQRVSLVLGSGGARGYCHIGAIQVLRERGYEIVAVAGTSMGALVGGAFAAGKLEEFSEWAIGLNQHEVMKLVDAKLTGPGVMRAERVLDRFRELVGERRIEDLDLSYTAVATDLIARREVWFQDGPLDVAVRASIALPGLFTPVMLNGRLLADGGLMAPVPVAPIAAAPSDLIIAIELGGRPAQSNESVAHESAEPGPLDDWVARFRDGATQAFNSFNDPEGESDGASRFDILNYSFEAMQEVINRHRLAGFPPDILITVPKDACRTLEFHLAEPMIELGRELATQALDEHEAA